MAIQIAQPTLRRMILRFVNNHLGKTVNNHLGKTAWPNIKKFDASHPVVL